MSIITKNRVVLLAPTDLMHVVSRIEYRLPGWWWSFSQSRMSLEFTFGPQPSCPIWWDALLAKDARGDKGFTFSMRVEDHDDIDFFKRFLNQCIQMIEPYRTKIKKNKDLAFEVDPNQKYRHQSTADLPELLMNYQDLTRMLPDMETAGFELRNLYLGSCDLSVDCSIRGIDTNNDNYPFDVSVDLTGNARLADSIREATYEFSKLMVDVES